MTKVQIRYEGDLEATSKRIGQIIDESDAHVKKMKSVWDYNQNLYQGTIEVDENIPEWKSTLFLMMTFGVVNDDVSGSMSGLIVPNDFFTIYPYRSTGKGKGLLGKLGLTKSNLEMSAAVLEKVMKVQEQQAKFYTECYYAVKDSSIKSLGIVYIDWVKQDKTNSYMDIDTGDIVKIDKEFKVNAPRFQSIAPEDFIIHPKAKSIDDSPAVGHWYEEYTSNLEDNAYYNISTNVKKFLQQFKDQNIEIPQKVRLAIVFDDKNQVHVRTENGLLLKSHVKPYKTKLKPYALCIKNPLQRRTYGVSTVDAYADIQELLNATTNDFVDANRMSIFRSFFVGSGFESKKPISIKPGAINTVKNVDQIKEFSVSPPPPDIYRFFEQFDSFTNRIIGNLNQSDSTGINTATEAKLVYSRAAGVFKDFVNYNRENFLRRLIQLWIELNQQFLKVEDIVGLVPEEELKKVEFEKKNMDITAQFGFWVTGEKNLEDRQTQLDKMQVFGNLMSTIQTLPPEINRRAYINRVVKNLDIGDDIMNPEQVQGEQNKPTAGDPASQEKISKDLAAMAQSQGMDTGALLQSLAQKFGTTPEDIVSGMSQMGSVNAYMQAALKQMATPQGPPDIQGVA